AGVAIRLDGTPVRFRVFPYENLNLVPFEAAVRALNPLVAVKIRSAAVHAALATIPESETAIYVDTNTRIQILDTMSELPLADKEQNAAFVRDERVMVCWSDDIDRIIPTCNDLSDKLSLLIWRLREQFLSPSTPTLASAGRALSPSGTTTPSGTLGLHSEKLGFANEMGANANGPNGAEKEQSVFEDGHEATNKVNRGWFGWKQIKQKGAADTEKAKKSAKRPTRLMAPAYNAIGAGLALFLIGNGFCTLLKEYWMDGNAQRFALVATMPFIFCVSLFFCMSFLGIFTQSIGPVAQYHQNSKYYSAVKPAPNPEVDNRLPHVTIQMPVYKESLKETIAPSCESLKKAMQTYARQGGTSSIMICDDGMQLLSPELAAERRAYYANHGIGWVARPGHSSKPDGFKRAGRFKKASNMNYALKISLKLEEHLKVLMKDENAVASARAAARLNRKRPWEEAAELAAGKEQDNGNGGMSYGWSNMLSAAGDEEDDREESLEDLALRMACDEVFADTQGRFRPWAANGRSLRVGVIILIVGSDTIVPEDCLRDAAREMHESPEVGVIQHDSDVMQVAHTYFENGITHFTRRINRAISFSCANGEVAAFVGHNAFLRWSAIQDVAFIDPADGERKIWSENNVSEDFDMALRLQLGGYTARWAVYSDGGFKEGVSLTCDDELNRWEKYAYGCSELLFNPFIEWPTKGPINALIHKMFWSPTPAHYKIGMLAYMFTYYGIAAAFSLSLFNYLFVGWRVPSDAFYLEGLGVWLSVTIVFPVGGNISFCLLEYRLGHRGFFSMLWETIMWIPFFFIFFGGLSINLSKAMLAHMFSYDISWGATKKEVERSNFFMEVPKIFKRFRVALVLSVITLAGIIILTMPLVPMEWAISKDNWSVIVPIALNVGCHILYPIALNPDLMVFSY
ncbi:hypothetical protein CPB86DRAFT_818657, partial [Serendipita vermifera]